MKKFWLFSIFLCILLLAGSQSFAQAEPGAEFKKELTIGFARKLVTTYPSANSDTPHNMCSNLTHNSLMYVNQQTLEIEAGLAKEWQIADDGITYTFHLREDVTFHNGQKLTADDVVFTFEYAKEKAGAGVKTVLNPLSKIRAIDESTVEMTLEGRNMDWLINLSHPSRGIICRSAVEELGHEKGTAIGTGRFMLVSHFEGDRTEFVQFPDYWGGSTPTEKITIRYIPESSARLIALQTGELDICIDPETSEYQFIEEDPDCELIAYDSTNLIHVALNHKAEFGGKREARLAVAHAIKVEDIIQGAYDGLGTRTATYWGWNQFGHYKNIEPYAYDLDLARDYLIKAGYPDGVELLAITNTAQRVLLLEILQSQLKEIGISLIIRGLDSAGFDAAARDGKYDIYTYGSSFISAGDDSRRHISPRSGSNRSFINDQKIMELMDVAVGESDNIARERMYAEVQKIFHDQCHIIPLFYESRAIAVRKGLSGAIIEGGGHHNFSNIVVKILK